MSQEQYYFYVWQNAVYRTCFGITGNLDNRRRKYEGHNGVTVEFQHVWQGPETLIKDLENKVKAEYHEYLWGTNAGKYEWIDQDIPLSEFLNWVGWEMDETYEGRITKIK